MTDLATRPGYDWVGYPIETPTGPICGLCHVRHLNVQAIRDCYAIAREQEAQVEADIAMEAAQLRHLENRGYDDARAQDEYEARNGVVGFIEAWHRESPGTCPCCNH
jgi:hypothetical protein